jgi:diacylglycerol kinase
MFSAIKGQSSFTVHFVMGFAVLIAGIVLRVNLWEWCILLLCVTFVLSAETFNSSLESMAKAIDTEHNPNLGRSLDMASAAVLVASVGAAIVGAIVFVFRLGVWLTWWT